MILALPNESDAQLNKWLKKGKEKLERTREKVKRSDTYQKAKEKVKQLDPTDWIKRKINEKYKLDNYNYRIRQRFNQIDRYLNKNTKLGNVSLGLYDNTFRKTKLLPDAGSLLDFKQASKFPSGVTLGEQKFGLYRSGKTVYIQSANAKSAPIGKELEEAILVSLYSTEIASINPEYVRNLKGLADAQTEMYGVLLLFYDGALNAYDKVMNISYGGISANDALNKWAGAMNLGYSFGSMTDNFRSFRNDLRNSQRMSEEVSQSASEILATIKKIKSGRNISVAEINTSLTGFKNIARNINKLADGVRNQEQIVRKAQANFSKLSNFYGISFIESIGDLYGYLGNYLDRIESGTRNYAKQFTDFSGGIESNSSGLYKTSYESITNAQRNAYQEDQSIVSGIIKLNNEIVRSEWHKGLGAKYTISKYVVDLEKANKSTEEAITTDIFKFNESKSKVDEMISTFPAEDLEEYFNNVLVKISEKQIIGGIDVESEMKPIASVITSLKKTPANVQLYTQLFGNTAKILDLYNKAKMMNMILFIGIAVIVLIVGGVIFLKRRKKPAAIEVRK